LSDEDYNLDSLNLNLQSCDVGLVNSDYDFSLRSAPLVSLIPFFHRGGKEIKETVGLNKEWHHLN
jgi:hypothetical protein